jgi:hypothetical protein
MSTLEHFLLLYFSIQEKGAARLQQKIAVPLREQLKIVSAGEAARNPNSSSM